MLMFCVAGCHRSTGQAFVSQKVGSREIRASVDGPRAFIHSEGEVATVRFGGHKVRVEKNRIVVDNVDTASVPPEATLIELVVSKGTVTATADGTKALSVKLRE